MAKKNIVFRLTAFSAAAGKYNPAAPLDGNEDNFYVDDDLTGEVLGQFHGDEDVTMTECGCLMVVADGMGGMNAGEVASEIAISTVREYFAPGKITPQMAGSPIERRQYLEKVIKEADRRVKTDARENPEHEGMGSTIIMAWIVGNKLTLSWCGDSRAYRYNPLNGIEPLSRDHSYVQELVNQGVLRYEDTFEHPQGNIVTRSLGDPNNPAKPESRQFEVFNDDIILLCSDGLSGVLRDRKTKNPDGEYYPGDTIEDVMAAHTGSMTECRDALLDAAEKADWYDNVTVLLCQIKSGAGLAPKREIPEEEPLPKTLEPGQVKPRRTKLWIGLGCLLLLVVAGLCGSFYYLGTKKNADKEIIADNDTITTTNELGPGDIILGEDVAEIRRQEADVEQGKGKGKQIGKQDVTPGKVSEKTDSVDKNVAPGPSDTWKTTLLVTVDPYTQPALKNVVKSIRDRINNAGNTQADYEKCQEAVNQLKIRAKYLGKLREYSGKLTPRGEDKFKKILAAIGDPAQYAPGNWEKGIKELNNFKVAMTPPTLNVPQPRDTTTELTPA